MLSDPASGLKNSAENNLLFIPEEEKFRIIADTAPVLIWIANTEKLCYYFNKVWLNFTGKSSEEEYGNGWINGIHPDDLKNYVALYNTAFNNRNEFNIEYRLKRHDGEYRWMLVNGVPRYTGDNTFAGYIGSCIDITISKEADKRKDEFISIASHELKTPVTTMKVYLHLLEDYFKKNNDAEHLQFTRKAEKQVTKLSKLINDLLDLSRIQEDGLEFNDEIISYADLIYEITENYQSLISTHSIEISGNCKSKIKGDKERITQAFMSMLNNAVKYSSLNNKIIIELSESGDFITTSIKDFGIGIAEKHHAFIFDKFYRVHETSKQTYPGLGIGLYITSEIIKRHGGNIKVNSKEGYETNFIFTLPIFEK